MKIISKMLLVAFVGSLFCGCASNPPATTKTNDPRLEAPAQTEGDSHTEIHGSISTSIGTTIK